ncbi:hypothetical protein Y032_0057g2768 [Ancylostoma ceylanicum]|uniref:6-phosphogluconate dehydrogenase NADP-binding domain-containing protein n=1 Tax=Ancylostoma ceylanicum TaxID=53326 RepID=A0A016U4B5_9BILA|nr:hypothetical protein Y032_0057g2768 [Ancylostoma ceylanicum]
MMLVKAGAPVDSMIDAIVPHLEEGDIIIDGGNSEYTDTNAVSQLGFDFEHWVWEESRRGADHNGVGISTQNCTKPPSLIVSFWSKRPTAASKARTHGDVPVLSGPLQATPGRHVVPCIRPSMYTAM